jgi:hypothetical protein
MRDKILQLKVDVERARKAGGARGVFGAESHGFVLNPPLSVSDIAAFEERYEVTLPQDYRLFLELVGNGGAGPAYGLFRLGEMDAGFEMKPWIEGEFVGTLSAPFQHTTPWNDIIGEPDEMSDEEGYERALDEFERRYFDPTLVDGAIPICHLGCALRQWLVVTGPEAGNVWNDYRADHRGLCPVTLTSKGRVTFYEWYRAWLDQVR